jgi:hypothetical protein
MSSTKAEKSAVCIEDTVTVDFDSVTQASPRPGPYKSTQWPYRSKVFARVCLHSVLSATWSIQMTLPMSAVR